MVLISTFNLIFSLPLQTKMVSEKNALAVQGKKLMRDAAQVSDSEYAIPAFA